MKAKDRVIDWNSHTTQQVTNLIYAGDGAPGAVALINNNKMRLFGCHSIDNPITSNDNPGSVLAYNNHGIALKTLDGAIFLTHLKSSSVPECIKLPATIVL